ncbi:MAG TPA: Na+/H+ antiporter subunit E [Burkholderiaceae bacterium]|nr:Na+/H+ antiporter subunit E [Burkholderiaceae bacterium]
MRLTQASAGDVAVRTGIFTLLWLAISGGSAGSWPVGAVSIAAAVLVSLRLRPARRIAIRPLAALRFSGFFLAQSLRGGVDVALRALAPRMPIAPDFIEYRMTLPAGPEQVFAVDVISLMPGTLSVEIQGNVLRVHVIDRRAPIAAALQRVERRVAALFGLPEPATQTAG